MSTIKRFFRDENGATAIEYGLIAAGISVAIIACGRHRGFEPEHDVHLVSDRSQVSAAASTRASAEVLSISRPPEFASAGAAFAGLYANRTARRGSLDSGCNPPPSRPVNEFDRHACRCHQTDAVPGADGIRGFQRSSDHDDLEPGVADPGRPASSLHGLHHRHEPGGDHEPCRRGRRWCWWWRSSSLRGAGSAAATPSLRPRPRSGSASTICCPT